MITLSSQNYDVAVVGAGMGGLSACIFLAQSGLSVICIEPEPFPHSLVGESLDWSTPALLNDLGIQTELLISDKVATQKNKIKVIAQEGLVFFRTPDIWLIRKLSNMNVDTLHVDRVELDQRLFATAQTLGVSFLWDRVSRIETDGDRILNCFTAGGCHIDASWFIDASGRARLFARAFGVSRQVFGRRKVCLWTYLDIAPITEGTTFYINTDDEYLAWLWEIPITPTVTSVGYITCADEIKQRRANGQSVEEILISELSNSSRFAELIEEQQEFCVRTTAFQGYINTHTSGENWLMVGEAAALADPLTGNGVTAALRHAQAASSLILESQGQTKLAEYPRWLYDANIRAITQIFNRSIEAVIYEGPLRRGLGASVAVTIYILVGFFTNVIYSKLQPQSRLELLLIRLWLVSSRLWIMFWVWMGRLSCKINLLY